MKRLSSILLAALFAAMAVFSAPSVAATGDNDQYELRSLPTYLYKTDQTTETNAIFTQQLPTIPYLNAADFFDHIYTVDFTTAKNPDGTYSISSANGTMIVNTENDTLYFDAFEHYILSDPDLGGSSMANTYATTAPPVIVGETKALTLDLGAYGIDLIEYQGNVWFPLPTLSDLVCVTYNSAEYLDGNLYYVHTMDDEYFDRSSLYENMTRDPAAVAFTYHELCFFMDHFYGAPAQSKLSAGIREKGFDKTLDEYSDGTRTAKELLQSNDLLYYYVALMYLDDVLFDGGHTSMTVEFFLAMQDKSSPLYDAFQQLGQEHPDYAWQMMVTMMNMQKRNTLEKQIVPLRDEAYAKYETVKTWNNNIRFIRSGDTGVFVFDSFKDEVVEPFKWSLDYAAENGIENFLIDLTCNGGGSSDVVAYIYTIMINSIVGSHTNEFDLRTLYMTTGNTMSEKISLDLNLDGVIDERDCDVDYDLNFAFLCTPLAFSCGNLLPCLGRENGLPVLGDNSGGGSCALVKGFMECCHYYTLSSPRKFVNDNGEDVDIGSGVDYPLFTQDAVGNKDYSGLYDLDDISRKIHAFYGDPVLGDADGDGEITISDATMIQKYLAEYDMPDSFILPAADTNEDGFVTISDVTEIQRFIAELEANANIGKPVKNL